MKKSHIQSANSAVPLTMSNNPKAGCGQSAKTAGGKEMNCKEQSVKNIAWDELKKSGSAHYRNDGGIQPIDLYRSMGILRPFAIASIVKYAVRNAGNGSPDEDPINPKDMQKIKHYADLLLAAYCGE
jgi:hypothetical protein